MDKDLKSPAVSIVVPVFNTAPFLKKCLSSLQNQSFGNLEILLVDDASPDGPHQEEPEVDFSTLSFTMEWDDEAKEMLRLVPSEFVGKAVSGVEGYAAAHHHPRITALVVEKYRKELGF